MLLFIPALVGVALLAHCWFFDMLRHPVRAAAFLLVGLALQYGVGTPYDMLWLSGLLLNAAVAFCLAVRMKLG
jgi:hypothetical protein